MQNKINVAFKLATIDDLDEIYALCRLVAQDTEVTDWDDEYPDHALLTEDINANHLYKIMHEGRIISIIMINSWAAMAEDDGEDIDTWNPAFENACGLARFCIDPALQGQGLGRRIASSALEYAKTLGFDAVKLHAAMANPLTLHLYESMGFNKAGEIHLYEVDFACYEKAL